jgi:predicted transcriptional regulator
MLDALRQRIDAGEWEGEPIKPTAEELAQIVTTAQIAAELGKSEQSVRQHIAMTQNVPGVKIGSLWVSTRALVGGVADSLRKLR